MSAPATPWMAGAPPPGAGARLAPGDAPSATTEPRAVRWTLTFLALAFLTFILVIPTLLVFVEAFSEGAAVYLEAITQEETRSAIALTLLAAGISVPLNVIFGLFAAWAIAKFDFPGKSLLITLIDLPFAVSPVISGMIFVLLYGAQGLFGPWLLAHGVQIIFTPVAIVLTTCFVTFPFVARELIPFMEALGNEQEEAAVMLGAGWVHTLARVTLPNIKWGLLYGVILCNARAMGEFGAVSVVSGHIRGETNTLPLHVEILYNEYSFAASFAVASLLLLLALATLVAKALVEWRVERQLGEGQGVEMRRG